MNLKLLDGINELKDSTERTAKKTSQPTHYSNELTFFTNGNMNELRKSIHGIDFKFLFREEEDDCYFKVQTENYSFNMRMDSYGFWKIAKIVPVWIKDLEADLGKAIDDHNT